MERVRLFDQHIASFIGRLPRRLHKPFDMLGYATPPIVWFGALLLFAIVFQNNDAAGFETTGVVLLLLPLASIIKFLFRRSRPPTIYANAMKIRSYSFPSSHAYSAALGSSYVAYLLLGHGLEWIAAIFYALIFVIGVSRVFIGAHYPSDVIAGWILGIVILMVIIL